MYMYTIIFADIHQLFITKILKIQTIFKIYKKKNSNKNVKLISVSTNILFLNKTFFFIITENHVNYSTVQIL